MHETVYSHTEAPRASLNAFSRMIAHCDKTVFADTGGLLR